MTAIHPDSPAHPKSGITARLGRFLSAALQPAALAIVNPKRLLLALGTATLLCGTASVGHAQILVFQAPASGANATSQNPSSIASNISVDGLQRIQDGTVGGNVQYKGATSVWVSEPHWASQGASNSYQGARSDSGYVFTITAAEGFTFDLTEVTFRHRATNTGPGTVGIKIGSTEYGGTGTSVSTSVGTYNSGAVGLTGLTSATFIVQGWGSGGTGNGEFQMNDLQVFGTINADTPPAANNNSVLSIPATSAFGRVMSGSSQTVAVSNVGDATTFSASATGGFTPSATGSVTEDGSSNLSVGVGSTLGSRSGTLTLNNTAPDSNDAGQGSAQAAITSALSATVVQNRSVDVGTVAGTNHGGIDLGRQMLGTVTGTHQITSTGSDAENTRLTFRGNANNTFTGYANTGLAQVVGTNADGVDVVLDATNTTANVGYSLGFTQTGARANDAQYIQFTTTNAFNGEGLAGETPLSAQSTPGTNQMRIYIQNATIVANREIEATGVNLGSVLVGTSTGAQDTTLSTAGDDDHRTRVTVNGSSVSSGGVTIAAGSTQLFDRADTTALRSISGNFATSGSKSVDLNFSVTGEGLANEAVNAVTVTATADVYQAASLTTNHAGGALGDLASVTVSNADSSDGGQRAAAAIVSRALTGAGWSVDGLAVGTTISQNGQVSGAVSFDGSQSGLLNGMIAAGSLTLGFQHFDQSIQGTSANDLGTRTWNFEAVVTGNDTGAGEAPVTVGSTFANLAVQSNRGGEARLLGGQASANRNIVMQLGNAPLEQGVSTNARSVGDYLKLSGTATDMFVLSLSYFHSESFVLIEWWDGANWVNAVNGNSGGSATFFGDTAFDADLHFQLGSFGFDSETQTAWAVLDHNSSFVVAIPEPSHASLLGLGVLTLISRRKRRLIAA